MNIFPAIDLYDKKAVRLYKGDYSQMTVYSENPIEIAYDFVSKGAKFIHVVDLEGAKNGTTPNIDIVKEIAQKTDLFIEIGGGIRSIDTIKKYLDAGVDRVILGTSAVTDEELLKNAISAFGSKVAVGADVKDGYIAIKGAKCLHIRRWLRVGFPHTRTCMQRTSLHSPSAPLPHSQQHFQVTS